MALPPALPMHNPRRTITRCILAPAALLFLVAQLAVAQAATGTIILRVVANGIPLPGVAVATRATNSVTDRSGRATFKLPTGQYTFRATPPGFRPESLSLFVGVGTTTRDLSVHQKAAVLPTVTSIPAKVDVAPPAPITANVPASTAERAPMATTHVQVVDRAALDEQIEQSPGVITDALGRLDGVRMQTLSAGSAGEGIRIRGLPARYTKILMNGLPLVGATPEGQDALQLPALGVDHVDVTPGVTSAFAGPTALGGIVNVVSASPTSPSQIVVNGTTPAGLGRRDLADAHLPPRWAATLLAGRSAQNPDDPTVTDGPR